MNLLIEKARQVVAKCDARLSQIAQQMQAMHQERETILVERQQWATAIAAAEVPTQEPPAEQPTE